MIARGARALPVRNCLGYQLHQGKYRDTEHSGGLSPLSLHLLQRTHHAQREPLLTALHALTSGDRLKEDRLPLLAALPEQRDQGLAQSSPADCASRVLVRMVGWHKPCFPFATTSRG